MVKSKKDKSLDFKPKEKVIKYLIENKEPVSIKHLSGSVAIDYKNTYNYIGDLTASGAIVQKIIGNTAPVEINLTPNQEIYNVEQKRTQEFLSENPKLKLIKQDIEEINYPFMIVLVFGSYVKKIKSKNSDVDICLISDNKSKTKELIERLNLLSLKLEIQEFTTSEFISMIEKNQRNLGHEIIKSNIILYGAENYYNLISKWMKKE
ncbi:MAG: nucleotidyltransferase domain-containing protein [Nanoarchaeota archaeon]|nr:nucleotidyltransferase domain-containing protein [Nanoarchaeota archaeon]